MEPKEYVLNFRKQHGRFPSQVEVSKALGVSPQAAIRALVGQAQLPRDGVEGVPEKRTGVKTALAIGLFLISGLTFVLSVYFTSLWFSTMFNLFIAGAISVSMVLYMVLSPQAGEHVKGFVKFPLWATFIIALVFSMGSTVAGQYNKLTENVDMAQVTDRAYLDLLRKQEADLETAIAADLESQRAYQDSVERLSATEESRIANSGYIRTERNMVNILAATITKNREALAGVRQSITEELLTGNVGVTEERADFYSWMAELFNVDRATMEFVIAAFPAVFIDIIAALSLNLALFLLRRDKE